MKKIVLIMTFMLFACVKVALSQTIVIVDSYTLQPIQGAVVYSEDKKVLLGRSDQKGTVPYKGLTHGNFLKITHPQYNTLQLTWEQIVSLNYRIEMIENINSIDEVIVSASRFEEKRKDVSQKIQVIRASEIQQMNQSSTADVLANTGNVFVQKSQLGGGSPVVRGFEANRVLLVVDGIRMNNAIYRSGHLQNVITIDNSILDRAEVIFGPGSVMYGSDALGGVLSFYTKNPSLSTDESTNVKAGAYLRYHSAASGYVTHANVSVGKKRFGSLTSFTVSSFGDLRQGAHRKPAVGNFGARSWYVEHINGKDSILNNPDTNLQIGSGYSQYDVLQKFLFKQSEKVKHILNFQFSTSSNIDRYDRLTLVDGNNIPRFAEWYYGPQQRLLASYTLELSNTKWYDNARVVIGYQKIQESRMDRKFNEAVRNNRYENLNVFTLTADVAKKIKAHELRYGIDAWYNDVASTAFGTNIFSGDEAPVSTRYASGGSQMYSLAAYLTHTWEINDRLIVNDGLRYSHVGLNALFNDTTFFQFPFSEVNQQNGALTGMIGLNYLPSNSTRINVLFSTGFRAPNVDDMSKVFDSSPGNVIIPNESLKPEYTYNGEIGLYQVLSKDISIQATGFYTWFTNALSVGESSFNGQDTILYDGVMSNVQSMLNAQRAFLYGLELGVNAKLSSNVSAYANYTLTKAQIVTDSIAIPLDHIPPGYGKIGIKVNEKGFTGEFFTLFNQWKRIEEYHPSGEDNQAYALPQGMPAWYTINLRLGYQFNKYVSLQLACENLLDMNYRVFASNISGPGRNFILTLRGNF